MDLKAKLSALDRLYKMYHDVIRTYNLACKKHCSACCTRNVTLTTLEGYRVADYISENGHLDLFRKLRKAVSEKRFQPRITTNRLAELCIEGKDFTEEESSSLWGRCPLLEESECLIYENRPFGCRCLVSKQTCQENGYADIDDELLTVNTLFLQIIEHVDTQGLSGNLTDMLLFMEPNETRLLYKKNMLKKPVNSLIQNQPAKALLIPPEHRIKVKPILQSIQNIIR